MERQGRGSKYDEAISPRYAFSFATSGGTNVACACGKYCMGAMARAAEMRRCCLQSRLGHRSGRNGGLDSSEVVRGGTLRRETGVVAAAFIQTNDALAACAALAPVAATTALVQGLAYLMRHRGMHVGSMRRSAASLRCCQAGLASVACCFVCVVASRGGGGGALEFPVVG
jgi:hypothetical protein